MNSTLEQHIRQADGRYFTDSELGLLENYAQSYQVRLETYSWLCEKSDQLVQQVLKELAKTDRAVVQEHGEKCHRDMSYVLQSIAVAILKDDDSAFREQFILWMQNIMAALQKETQSARAYTLLQKAIAQQMPAQHAELINHNLQEFIQALSTNV